MAKKTTLPPMYPIQVYADTRTYVTRERNPDDEWSNDDIANETTIRAIGPVKKASWHTELTIPFPLEQGKEYYLVYVSYSTGDSFHKEAGRTQYVDVFIDVTKAGNCGRALDEHYKMSEQGRGWNSKVKPPKGFKEYEVEYINEAGMPSTFHPAYVGYFESLTGVYIERVVARFNQDDEVPADEGLIRYRY